MTETANLLAHRVLAWPCFFSSEAVILMALGAAHSLSGVVRQEGFLSLGSSLFEDSQAALLPQELVQLPFPCHVFERFGIFLWRLHLLPAAPFSAGRSFFLLQ